MSTSQTFTLVTAADSSHFNSLLQLLRSVRLHERRAAVFVYDLGFRAEERAVLLRRFPQYELRSFDFAAYPPHFNIKVRAGEYAWKPAIIWELLAEIDGALCWMDAGNALVSSLQGLRKALESKGFYSPYSPGTIGDWTHPGTLRALGLPEGWGAGFRNLNGACIAFDPRFEAARALAKEWRDGAMVKDCIAPPGSDRSNHRQDQALLTVLAYRAGLVEGVEHEYLGYRIHQDVEGSPLATLRRSSRRAMLSLALAFKSVLRPDARR